MLTICILFFLTGSFCSYLVFIYIPNLYADYRKAVALLVVQDQYLTRLQEDNLTLVTIAKQQQALKNQYAQHLESDIFPSLTVTNLN